MENAKNLASRSKSKPTKHRGIKTIWDDTQLPRSCEIASGLGALEYSFGQENWFRRAPRHHDQKEGNGLKAGEGAQPRETI